MTKDQIDMAIALGRCTFVPGTNTKRFARQMKAIAEQAPEKDISFKQHMYLCKAVYRFRRQIPQRIVDIANAEIERDAA